jgi:hypothetical protein
MPMPLFSVPKAIWPRLFSPSASTASLQLPAASSRTGTPTMVPPGRMRARPVALPIHRLPARSISSERIWLSGRPGVSSWV